MGEDQKLQRKPVMFTLLLVAVLLGAGAFYYYLSQSYMIGAKESINILCYGVQPGGPEAGTDALAVISVNPVTKSIGVIALPGSTVTRESAESDSETDAEAEAETDAGLNAATLSEALKIGGEAALVGKVEEIVGAPVHHRVKVDFAGFVELIDALGGIELSVTDSIIYRDKGEVVFAFEPGKQVLDGEAVLKYVRYLAPSETEADRFRRQRQVVMAMREAATKAGWFKNATELGKFLTQYCSTDLDLATIIRLTNYTRRVQAPVQVSLLPGQAGEIGWVPDQVQLTTLASTIFHNPGWQAATR